MLSMWRRGLLCVLLQFLPLGDTLVQTWRFSIIFSPFCPVSVRYYCWRRATEGHDSLARLVASCEGISTWKTATFLRRRERCSPTVVCSCQITARSGQHRHVVMPDYIHLRHNWNVFLRVRQKDQWHYGRGEFWDFRKLNAFVISRRDGCGLEYNSWPAHGITAWLWPTFKKWRT